MKAVLRAAGNLKLKSPNENEESIVLKSINNVNLPKFLADDIVLFKGITSDLFPDVTLEASDYGEFTSILKKNLTSMKLEYNDLFIERIIQIYEMILVRHGLMIIGEPISGKTSAYKALSKTLNEMADLEMEGYDEVIFSNTNSLFIYVINYIYSLNLRSILK